MITARDELESWTTAGLADVVGEVPGVADDPPAGWTEMVGGRGVFVRRTDPARTDPARTDPARTDPPAQIGPVGPDVWYLHGLAGSSSNWTSLAGLLADRAVGHLVDLPGHGRSDPPPRGRYSLLDDATVVAELIRRLSRGPVHLVGNSMGGMVATVLAARFPELIASLTLISPAVPDLRLTKDRGADRILGLLLLPGTTGVAVRQLSGTSPMARARGMGQLCYGDPTRLSDHDFEVAAADLAWRAPLPWVHTATIGTLRALMRSYLRRTGSFRRDAARIGVPTLVIWGTRDALVDARLSRRTVEAFPDASLLMIRGAGHTAQMEEPLLTARAIARLWEKPGAPHVALTGRVATSSA